MERWLIDGLGHPSAVLPCRVAKAADHCKIRKAVIVNRQSDEWSRKKAKVLASFQSIDGTRCVDIFLRSDGAFEFREFRCDPEDAGQWTLAHDYSDCRYSSKDEALTAVASHIAWFSESAKLG